LSAHCQFDFLGEKIMKRIISPLIFAAIFLGLGYLALAAFPAGPEEVAQANPAGSAAIQEQDRAPDAPEASLRYNHVALPLDASGVITPFTAAGLLTYVGPSALQVANLNAVNQNLDFWSSAGFGIISGTFTSDQYDYPLEVGRAYLIQVDNTSADVFTIVGDVPDAGTIDFEMYGNGGTCKLNEIMVPLDQYDAGLNTAVDLANDIGNVEQVNQVNAVRQDLDVWFVDLNFGIISGTFQSLSSTFPVQTGYPYWVCVKAAGNGNVWP
jgi:hypothetical protein